MKNFEDFLSYVSERGNEISYDTVNKLRNEWNPDLTLSQADITLITRISHQRTLALLRQYHERLTK